MNGIFGLCWQLATLIASANADPVAIPVTHVAGGELNAILPSETVLLGIIAGQALQLIAFLARSIWKAFMKDKDKTADKLEELIRDVQSLKAEVKILNRLPDEAEIIERLEQRAEFLVFKVVRDLGLKENR